MKGTLLFGLVLCLALTWCSATPLKEQANEEEKKEKEVEKELDEKKEEKSNDDEDDDAGDATEKDLLGHLAEMDEDAETETTPTEKRVIRRHGFRYGYHIIRRLRVRLHRLRRIVRILRLRLRRCYHWRHRYHYRPHRV